MDFELTEEQRFLRDSIVDFARRELNDDVVERDKSGSFSREAVDEDYPLLAKQVIDSLGMLKLVSLVDEEFDVEIEADDIVPDNWKTIRDIAGLVETKRAG